MGIFASTGAPIGYAYQNKRGPGIDLKFNPEMYSSPIAKPKQSKESSNDLKYDAQIGVRRDLEGLTSKFPAMRQNLESKALEMKKSAKTEQESQEVNNWYLQNLNEITNLESQVGISKVNAKFDFDYQNQINKLIVDKNLSKSVAFTDVRIGSISSGDEFLALFNNGNAPVSLSKKDYKVNTLENYTNEQNEYSWAQYNPTTKKVETSTYTAPLLNISNSDDASAKVRNIVSVNGYEEIIKGFDGIYGGWDARNRDNKERLEEVVDNVWNIASEDVRNYALSNTLQMGIVVGPEGKEKYYSGDDVVQSIIVLKNKASKLSDDDPQKETLMNEAKNISDGYMNSSKQYLRAMASNSTAGLRQWVNSYKEGVKEDKSGDSAEFKAATQFQAVLEGAEDTEMNMYMTVDGVVDYHNIGKSYGIKKFSMNNDDMLYQFDKLWGVNNMKELKGQELDLSSEPDDMLFNGISINKQLLPVEEQKAFKLVKVGSNGVLAPDFYTDTDGDYIRTEIKQTKNGQAILTPYIEVVYETNDGSIKLPIYVKDRIEYKSIKDMERFDLKTGYNIQKVGSNYQVTLHKKGANPYYGTAKQTTTGAMVNRLTSREADEARPLIQQKNLEAKRERLAAFSVDQGRKAVGIQYGKVIYSDNAEETYKELSQGKSELQTLQAITDFVETTVLEGKEKEDYRQELLKKHNEKKNANNIEFNYGNVSVKELY